MMNAMNHISARPLVSLLFLIAPCTVWAQDAGLDFSETSATVPITTTSPNFLAADTLRLRNIDCPTDGFVVAIANGQLQYATNSEFTIQTFISIGRDSSVEDAANHALVILGTTTVHGAYDNTVSIQRVDACRGGTSHAYRFLATNTRGGFVAPFAFMRRPSLILMFFRFRL